MNENQYIFRYETDLNKGLALTTLPMAFLQDDNKAHTFLIKTKVGGENNSLYGATIKGFFISATAADVTIELPGTYTSANEAVVTLTQDCYALAGRFFLIVRAETDETKTSIFYAEGYVSKTRTDKVIEPSGVVPSLSALEAKVDALSDNINALDEQKAPAGFGYGGKMDYLDASTGSLDVMLGEMLESMVNYSARQIQFYDPSGMPKHDNKFIGTLWRYTANYAVLDAVTYTGVHAVKCMRGGVWQPWEYNDFKSLEARVMALETASVSSVSEPYGGDV